MTIGKAQISEGIVIYLGYGRSVSPVKDSQEILELYGRNKGTDILNHVHEIIKKLGEIEIDWRNYDLQSASEEAVNSIRTQFPWLENEALEALGWKFTFDWR